MVLHQVVFLLKHKHPKQARVEGSSGIFVRPGSAYFGNRRIFIQKIATLVAEGLLLEALNNFGCLNF
jgi:hypothetical protein